MKQINIFSNKITSVFLALFVCALWGALYPMVKIGYNSFKISYLLALVLIIMAIIIENIKNTEKKHYESKNI